MRLLDDGSPTIHLVVLDRLQHQPDEPVAACGHGSGWSGWGDWSTNPALVTCPECLARARQIEPPGLAGVGNAGRPVAARR